VAARQGEPRGAVAPCSLRSGQPAAALLWLAIDG
jgi:hypothetical protein